MILRIYKLAKIFKQQVLVVHYMRVLHDRSVVTTLALLAAFPNVPERSTNSTYQCMTVPEHPWLSFSNCIVDLDPMTTQFQKSAAL